MVSPKVSHVSVDVHRHPHGKTQRPRSRLNTLAQKFQPTSGMQRDDQSALVWGSRACLASVVPEARAAAGFKISPSTNDHWHGHTGQECQNFTHLTRKVIEGD